MPVVNSSDPPLLVSADKTLSEEDIADMLAEAEALDTYFARRGHSTDLLQVLKAMLACEQK
jgi:hypothetical protein